MSLFKMFSTIITLAVQQGYQCGIYSRINLAHVCSKEERNGHLPIVIWRGRKSNQTIDQSGHRKVSE